MLLSVTVPAIKYLDSIVSQQSRVSATALVLRIMVSNPHTDIAKIDLSYFLAAEVAATDIRLTFGNFDLYVEQQSTTALLGAIIDYKFSNYTNQYELHINAPNLQSQPLTDNSYVEDELFTRVNDYINKEINRILEQHQGSVQLIRLQRLSTGVEVELKFTGGCKGCSLVQVTLKHSIESRLMKQFKEITSIKDITEHVATASSYC